MLRSWLFYCLILLFCGAGFAQLPGKIPEWITRERFLRACEDGDSETVDELLKNGVSPKVRDRFGQPAILRAVRSSSRTDYDKTVAVLKLLLAAGADINDTNPYGTSAIFLTRSANSLVSKPHQFLLDAGAKTDLKDKYGLNFEQRPNFYDFVKLDAAEVVWRLLLEGDLGSTDVSVSAISRHSNSATILMAAAYYDVAISHMSRYSAQTDVDSAGDTYLFYLTGKDNLALTEFSVVDRKILDLRNRVGETALMRAAKLDNDLLVIRFLSYGANADIKDEKGKTALLYSAEYDYFATTLALLSASDPNLPDNDGATALIVAAKADNRKALTAIINAKLSVKSLEKEAAKNVREKAGLLKTAAALDRIDPDRRDRFGRTALMYAAANGSIDSAKYLLQVNPSLTIKDNNGETAADIAKETGHIAMLPLLTVRKRPN